MTQKITRSVKDMVEQARSRINELPPEDVIRLSETQEVVIVDLRDVRERQKTGHIKGSLHVPRGMLEFWIDPESPYHKEIFAEDKHFIFHCASGWRSALATDRARSMGLAPVSHIEGGLNGWIKAGGAIETAEE